MASTVDYVAFSRDQVSKGKQAAVVTPEGLRSFLARQSDVGDVGAITFDGGKLKAGASSGTILFEAEIDGRLRELVFRYDLGGTFFKQYALEPQYWVMRAVHTRGIPAPDALWLDAEGEVAGYPGLVMGRIHGSAPSMALFGEGPIADASPAERRTMVENTIAALAELHRLDVASLGLIHHEQRGTGEHFIDREIGWMMRELHLALDHQLGGPSAPLYREQMATLSGIAQWLTDHAPRHRAPELAHGDAMLTNFMYRDTDVVGMLDWELTHIGIGEMDIAYQSAGRDYFGLISPPPPGLPSLDAMFAHYRACRGKLEDEHYAGVMGAFRCGLISVLGKARLPAAQDEFKRRSWNVGLTQFRELGMATA